MEWHYTQPFAVQVLSEGSHVVVALHGELDVAGEAELSAQITRVLDSRPTALTVDLRKLTFMDSTGLRAVLQARERCAELECSLVLVRGCPAVQRTFDVSGLGAHFTFAGPPEQYASTLEATG